MVVTTKKTNRQSNDVSESSTFITGTYDRNTTILGCAETIKGLWRELESRNCRQNLSRAREDKTWGTDDAILIDSFIILLFNGKKLRMINGERRIGNEEWRKGNWE